MVALQDVCEGVSGSPVSLINHQSFHGYGATITLGMFHHRRARRKLLPFLVPANFAHAALVTVASVTDGFVDPARLRWEQQSGR